MGQDVTVSLCPRMRVQSLQIQNQGWPVAEIGVGAGKRHGWSTNWAEVTSHTPSGSSRPDLGDKGMSTGTCNPSLWSDHSIEMQERSRDWQWTLRSAPQSSG